MREMEEISETLVNSPLTAGFQRRFWCIKQIVKLNNSVRAYSPCTVASNDL
jgi:hypothetical protein